MEEDCVFLVNHRVHREQAARRFFAMRIQETQAGVCSGASERTVPFTHAPVDIISF